MSKVELPLEIENLKNGPRKRDMIRHYKKQLRYELTGKKAEKVSQI